jgi:hypothetical protein
MNDTERIARLERKLNAAFAVIAVLGGGALVATLRAQPGPPDVLRVRQITIVDQKGTGRLILGAPLPDPIVDGRRVRRNGAVSGMVVLDARGNERGGFATGDSSGEVFIGLDSEESQEVLLLSNPDGGSHLSISSGRGNMARIGVLDGKPTLLIRESGQTVFEQPAR